MQPSNAALFVVDRIARALVGVALAAALCVAVVVGQAVKASDASAMIKAVEPIATFCFNLG